MVFIPIYSDQFRNAKRCADAGFAEILNFRDISLKNLFEKLNMVLNNQRYKSQINLVSQQFRDNLVDPMEETMYWIEFLGRHKKDYPFFKPHGPHVSWFEYFYMDIILFITIVLYIAFVVMKYCLKIVWNRFDTIQNLKQKLH